MLVYLRLFRQSGKTHMWPTPCAIKNVALDFVNIFADY